jgi:hypothetical protein
MTAAVVAIPGVPLVGPAQAASIGKFNLQYRGAWEQDISDVVVNKATGDVFVVGFTRSLPDANGPITNVPAQGNAETGFLSKINVSGQIQWTKAIGKTDYDVRPAGIAMDADGNVYVVMSQRQRTSGSSYAAFTQKFSSNGMLLWSNTMAGGDQLAYGIDVSNGVVAIAVVTAGAISGYTSAGNSDVVIRTMTASLGITQKTVQFGTNGFDTPFAGVKILSDGSIIVGGSTQGILAPGTGRIAQRVDEDYFISQWNFSGSSPVLVRTRQWGDRNTDRLMALAVHNDGRWYASGMTNGAVGAVPNRGGLDGVLFGMDSTGAIRWQSSIGSSGEDQVSDIAKSETTGNILFYGITSGVTFNASVGGTDLIGGTVSPDGNLLASIQLGSSGNDIARKFALRGDSSPVLIGTTAGTFDGTPANGFDGFVLSAGIDISSITGLLGTLRSVPLIAIPTVAPLPVALLGENLSLADIPGVVSVETPSTATGSPAATVVPPLCNEVTSPSVYYRRLVAQCAGLAFRKGTETRIRLSTRNAAGVCSLSPRRRLKITGPGNCKVKIRVTHTNGNTKAVWITYKVSKG